MDTRIYIYLAIVALIIVIAFIFWDYIEDLIIGLEGDRRFSRIIKRFAKSNDYLVLSNICVKLSEDNFGIIKHILVADKFIYVIHGKTVIGSITGVGDDEKWIHQDNQKRHIVNPVKENRKLIVALANQLNEYSNEFVNIVVYSKTAIVDKIQFINPLDAVVEEKDLVKYIKMMEKTASVNDLEPTSAETLVNKIAILSASNYRAQNKMY